MSPSRIVVPRIPRRDPLHRLPGCWYIAGSRMLRSLDERTVEAVARQSVMATYAPGQLLHEAGEPMTSVAFISSGRVKVCRSSRDGKHQTIALLGPGDAFGEIGIVDTRAQAEQSSEQGQALRRRRRSQPVKARQDGSEVAVSHPVRSGRPQRARLLHRHGLCWRERRAHPTKVPR